jgi:hypothetical protein
MNDRAVSETIGFVLAFVLVTATIGVVYATGFGGLYDAQRFEQVNNAERAFDVLADNVEDVRREGAPSRATELRLGGASLDHGDPVRVRVHVNDSDPTSTRNATYTMTPRPLVYSGVGDSELTYVAGAVFRASDDHSVMVQRPGFVHDDHRAIVPFLVTYPRDDGGVSGDATVLVLARHQSSGLAGQFRTGPGSDARVNVTVESPRAGAWKRYFEAKGFTAIDADESDDTVTYQFHTDHLVVPETVVEFELQR